MLHSHCLEGAPAMMADHVDRTSGFCSCICYTYTDSSAARSGNYTNLWMHRAHLHHVNLHQPAQKQHCWQQQTMDPCCLRKKISAKRLISAFERQDTSITTPSYQQCQSGSNPPSETTRHKQLLPDTMYTCWLIPNFGINVESQTSSTKTPFVGPLPVHSVHISTQAPTAV
jgi:hypothetical protein